MMWPILKRWWLARQPLTRFRAGEIALTFGQPAWVGEQVFDAMYPLRPEDAPTVARRAFIQDTFAQAYAAPSPDPYAWHDTSELDG